MNKIKIVIFLLCVFILPVKALANDIEMITYESYVNINKNRTVDIKDTYLVNFLDQVTSIKKEFITEIEYDEKKETILLSEAKLISGSSLLEDNILTMEIEGTKGLVEEYSVSYTYDYGKDSSDSQDEIYVYLIDGKYEANISQYSFTINLEDTDKIKDFTFYVDGSRDADESVETEEGIIDESGIINYTYSDNKIVGESSKFLTNGETIVLKITFEDNYFVGANNIYSLYWMGFLLIFPTLGLALAIYSYIRYGKSSKIKEEIKKEEINKYTSAEIAYMYKGYVKEPDLVSVLIELANDGYIMFLEQEDGYKLGTNNTFNIQKLKDYEGNNAIKKIFFDKMFFDKSEITCKDIEYNMYNELVQARSTLDNIKNKKKYFNIKIPIFKKILLISTLVSLLITTFYPSYLTTDIKFIFIIASAVIFLGLYILFIYDDLLTGKIMFGGTILAGMNFMLIRGTYEDTYALIIYLIGTIFIYLTVYFYNKLSRRTREGQIINKKAELIKKDLERFSSKELEKNPNYFYEVYSYVYALELIEVWNKIGRKTIKEYPSWYITNEEFSLKKFEIFIKNMIYVVTQSMYKNNGFKQVTEHVEYDQQLKVKQMDKFQ